MREANFKIGDVVIQSARANSEQVRKIERTTKTMAITNTGERYNISSGNIIGGSQWNWGSIKIATEEEIIRVKAKNLRNRRLRDINDFIFSKLNDEQIKQIIDIIK